MTEKKTFQLPVWLLVSLLVNALLIGLIIGGGLGPKRSGGGDARGTVAGERDIVMGIENNMSGEERAAFRSAIREAFSESRDQREELVGARLELGLALMADPYDRAQVDQGFARLRAADDAVKVRLHTVLTDQMGGLTLAQRQAIIRGLSDRDRSSRDGRGDREGRDEERREGRGD